MPPPAVYADEATKERFRAVLRPFAAEAACWDGIDPDETPLIGQDGEEPERANFRVCDLLAARELLMELSNEKRGVL